MRVGMSVEGAEQVSRKFAGDVGREVRGKDVIMPLRYFEDLDFDSEIREQGRDWDREILSSDFYFTGSFWQLC